MGMMVCPNCGGQVSDRAEKCVHCGAELLQKKKIYCPDCGTELEEDVKSCPNCGCPIEGILAEKAEPQQVEVTGVKVTQKSKKLILLAIAAIIVIAAIAGVGSQIHKKNVAAQVQEQREEYKKNLKSATYTMLSGAGEAEKCCNQVKKVWYNAIYKKSSLDTNKYTKPAGYFVSDFNIALKNLYSDTTFSAKIATIKKNKTSVDDLMKKLKNPPKDYKEAYDAALKFYNAYLSLTSLAESPTGSLQTYSQNFTNTDQETVNSYNAVKIYLEK